MKFYSIIFLLLGFIILCNPVFSQVQFSAYDLYDRDNGYWEFIPLSKETIKNLNEESKKVYKNCLKGEKYRLKANNQKNEYRANKLYLKALSYNKSMYFLNLYIGDYYYNNKDYNKAYDYYNRAYLLDFRKYYPDLSFYVADCSYRLDGDKKYIISTLEYWLTLKNKDSNYVQDAYDMLAWSYCKIGKYDKAIEYATKLLSPSSKARLLLFCNYKKKNIQSAQKYALELIKLYPNDPLYYYWYAEVSLKPDVRINYYKKARSLAKNDSDLVNYTVRIATIEQSKIDNAVKGLQTYVKAPNWFEVVARLEISNVKTLVKMQDDFFEKTNNCIKNYSKRNLAACFNQVNTDSDKLIQDVRTENFRQQQLYEMRNQTYQMQQQSDNLYNLYRLIKTGY